jgi:uncharacterized FlaG/YvyC family protein
MSVQVTSITPIAAVDTQGASAHVSPFPQSSAASQQNDTSASQATAADLQQAVDTLNSHFSGVRNDLRFSIVADLGVPMVAVVDAQTGTVLWQIPSENALRAARAARDNGGSGSLLQTQA